MLEPTDTDLERERCSQITAACILAERPALAFSWIALGTPLTEVMDALFYAVCAERAGVRPSSVASEFDERPAVFVGHGISRQTYITVRKGERSFFEGVVKDGDDRNVLRPSD